VVRTILSPFFFSSFCYSIMFVSRLVFSLPLLFGAAIVMRSSVRVCFLPAFNGFSGRKEGG
jgi:hypothetical protein